MRHHYSIVFTMLVFLFCGCAEQTNKHSSDTALIQTTDTLSFPLEKGSGMPAVLFLHTDPNGHEYMVFRDHFRKPRIFVYDLEDPSDGPKTVHFHNEGPNGTGASTTGFFMRSWDEIYLPNTNTREISVIDSSGVLKRVIRYGDDNEPYKMVKTSSLTNKHFLIFEDKMFCYQQANRHKGDKMLTESPVDLILDLKDGSVTPSPLCYPSEQVIHPDKIEKFGLVAHSSRCLVGDKIVYSFWYGHDLHVYDIKTGKITKKTAKSRYLPDEQALSPYNRFNSDATDGGLKEICEMPFYRYIYYDQYRKVYYRIAFPPAKCELESNLYGYFQEGRNTACVMVLDEELNVICETLLPEHRFNPNVLFINKDGLWISCNHYLNPGYDEENLQFVRFALE